MEKVINTRELRTETRFLATIVDHLCARVLSIDTRMRSFFISIAIRLTIMAVERRLA